MTWITFTLLMFIASIILYLTLRQTAKQKFPTEFNNLAFFLLPAGIYVTSALVFYHSYRPSWSTLLIIALTGVLFSYVPSLTSLKSLELAPNPGYSLIISKNYVVLSTIISVLVLHQPLSMLGLVAIGCIVLFSSLVIYTPKKTSSQRSLAWLPLAFGSFVGWALLSLISRYLAERGVPTIVFLAYLSMVGTCCILVEMRFKKARFQLIGQHWKPFVLIGLASAAFNFCNFYAVSIAPNVGYVNAANAASIGAVTLLAISLFKDEASPRKIIGIIGCIGSMTLLFINNGT